MAGKLSCIAILAVNFVTIFIPIVVSNDYDPIPADIKQLNNWYLNNVQHYSSRMSTLDYDLVTAEETQRVITVSQDGKGQFKTITDAVKSIPNNNKQRVIVAIAGGTYFEKVTIDTDKPFVTFYGSPDSMPTLVYNATTASSGGISVDSATLIVQGNYFLAVNMIFKNSAPKPDPSTTDQQAVALRAFSDKSAFYNSHFIGFQDTLLDDVGQHFYMNCYIEGTVDFIWGNGKSIFLNTELHVIPEYVNVITSNSRESPSQDSAYSFVLCSVTGTSWRNTLLGRALHTHATVIYSYTYLSDVVYPIGWSSSTMPDGYESTIYFREYMNTGPGTQGPRAPCSKNMTANEATPFLTLSFIQGSKWLLPPPRL